MQNLDIFSVESLFLLSTLLRVLRQGISSSVSFTLAIIDSKIVTKKFLGQADLSRAQTLYIHELAEVIVVCKYEHLILRLF